MKDLLTKPAINDGPNGYMPSYQRKAIHSIKDTHIYIGKSVRGLRMARNLSIKQLAMKTGLYKVSVQDLKLLCEGLSCKSSALLDF